MQTYYQLSFSSFHDTSVILFAYYCILLCFNGRDFIPFITFILLSLVFSSVLFDRVASFSLYCSFEFINTRIALLLLILHPFRLQMLRCLIILRSLYFKSSIYSIPISVFLSADGLV